MGKWVEEYCDCPNRVRLPHSNYDSDRPHRGKERLTKEEEKELEEWNEKVCNMFQCGHRNGVAFEFWPGDIVLLGILISDIFDDERDKFDLFVKVGDWRCYDDELLLIPPDEAAQWKLQVEELQKALNDLGNLPKGLIEKLILEFFRTDQNITIDLEARLNEAADAMPPSLVENLKQNVRESRLSELESSARRISETLKYTADLCDVSIQTRNPIRMLW